MPKSLKNFVYADDSGCNNRFYSQNCPFEATVSAVVRILLPIFITETLSNRNPMP